MQKSSILTSASSARSRPFQLASPLIHHTQRKCRTQAHTGSVPRRIALLSSTSLLLLKQERAHAAGIEGIKPAESIEGGFTDLRRKNQDFLDKGAEAFENSDIMKTLRERSNANRDANKRALQERYCYRQAELGVGDCAGLRLIPGATKSGKQKTPEWLKAVLQKLGQLPPDESPKSPS